MCFEIMPREASAKRTRILDAALLRISRYGFRRTSMEDIATEAGISRAALYLQFRNKEEIFRGVAEELQRDALERAGAALAGDEPLEDRLRAALEAKTLRFVEIAFSSPHGGEILDESNRLCGDIIGAARRSFLGLLTRAFRRSSQRGEIDLAAVGLGAAEAADLLAGMRAREKARPVRRVGASA
jgi:AcrR family transcriptional regulator